MNIRAFIALPLPEEITQTLGRLGKKLNEVVPSKSVSWVAPAGIHLTLNFLGDEVTPAQVEKVKHVLDTCPGRVSPFTLQLGKLGCFPKARAPRVIWVGLQGELEPLQTLKIFLDEQLEPLGWPPEQRRFSPHLTIGRVKDIPAVGEAGLPFSAPVKSLSFKVAELHLYQSELTPQGAKYSLLHTAEL